MKQKSLKLNTILYIFKSLMSVIFPMLTFPYASRVLGADGIGNVTFSYSIVSYFILIAGLGVISYAIREGAKYRENKEELSLFVNEVYTINVIATFVSSLAFGASIFLFEKLRAYQGVLLILGLAIPLTTVGVEWIFNIFEDYLYITIRSLVVQFISLIILFIFVRQPEDVYGYAIFFLFSSVASNVFNLFYARKYCHFHLCFHKGLMKHIKPIMVIFASTVASTIYVSTDTTLLGIMHDDATVGYYAASTKIYNMLRTTMDAIVSVSFARLSFYLGNHMQEQFDSLIRKLIHVTFLLVGPLTIGLFCLSEQAIHILNGAAYEPAIMSLRILCWAFPISVMGGMLTRTLFLPYKHEKDILIATIVGAVVNFGLNLYLIPKWEQDGAAMTTLIAEVVVLGIHLFNLNKFYKVRGIMKCFGQVLVASLMLAGICWFIKQKVVSDIWCTVLAVLCSGVAYVLVLVVLKNELLMECIQKIKMRGKNISKE